MLIFEKLYVSNIKYRLEEIRSPNIADKKRWIMELMQNAKDSLESESNTNGQEKVEIFIEIKYQNKEIIEVIFSHDGPPFTYDSFIGLIYKISQGKENTKTTGKFSTGFLVTHILSKTPEISGNKYDSNNNLVGFSITMNRNGETESEIIENFREMQKSYYISNSLYDRTTFKYKIESKLSRDSVNQMCTFN